ncbi:MAG: molybdenum cofactor guanylyltransferase [Planctomycetes bacterium]|nr:molybdenum cofactor guanylyltransferase [Planctomycetota bacterium]
MSGETIGILVGGQSSRMGRPKALIQVEGGTLLERTAMVARQTTSNVVLLGTPPFDLPMSLRELPVWPDEHEDIGPIAGLQTLLSRMKSRYGLMLSCDMPRLGPSLLKWMSGAAHVLRADAVVCQTEDPASPKGHRMHPCCAVYDGRILDKVTDAIDNEEFGLCELLTQLKVHPHVLLGDNARWLDNWNVPEDVDGDGAQAAT